MVRNIVSMSQSIENACETEIRKVVFNVLVQKYGQDVIDQLEKSVLHSSIEKTAKKLIPIIDSLEVKTCPVCQTVFVPCSKNQIYCCKQCSEKTFEQGDLKSDEAMLIYNRAYRTIYARYMRGNLSRDEFYAWKENAKEMLKAVRNEDITFEQYQKKITHGIRRWERFGDF